jgi:hypothetical protein
MLPQALLTGLNSTTSSLIQATITGNQAIIKETIKKFRDKNGATNYLELMRQPVEDRIPGLVRKFGKETIHKILVVQIEIATKFFNIKNNLTPTQIFELGEMIIEEADCDQLSLEDIFIFLSKLIRGQMGKIYDRLDTATFMEMLDAHRDQRHHELRRFREQQHSQHKCAGPVDRSCDNMDAEKTAHQSALAEHLKILYTNESNLQDKSD